MATTPKRYDIKNLLVNGAQPYKNLDEETREYLTYTIKSQGRNLRKMPVSISGDGILYDGHQRLQILAHLGKVNIGVGEFIINPKVIGREAAYFEAMKVNANRRHLTGRAKAAAMWDLVRHFALSQTTIARHLGMKQQSVSELMNKYRPADIDSMPSERIGEDGRAINVSNIGKDPTKLPPAYEMRKRLMLSLHKMREAAAHVVADASGCGRLSPYDFNQVMEDIDVLRNVLASVEASLRPEYAPEIMAQVMSEIARRKERESVDPN